MDDAAAAVPCGAASAPRGRGSWVGEPSYDELLAVGRPVPLLQDPEKLAALFYTSGTSGRPRAAMFTHRPAGETSTRSRRWRPPMIRGDDVVLAVLPMFHVYGPNAVLGSVLRHRAVLVLAERFDPTGRWR